MPSKSEEWKKAGRNVVVLHQFDRARSSPNPSPFALKFETYLRVAEIEYVTDFSKPMSAKGKSPWMTFNGKDVADSQLCMEHLAAKMPEKDLSAHLSPAEVAQAKGMRAILEDHFYFCTVLNRWVYNDLGYLRKKQLAPLPVPRFMQGFGMKYVARQVRKQSEGQGIGRHSKEEVIAMAVKDLRALSDFLGDKPYMMGDRPSDVDCVLFGFIVVTLYGFPDGDILKAAIEKDFPNLKAHMELMQQKYWPDWDECKYKKK